MIPWKNSWFQLAAATAVIAAGLLLFDWSGGGKPGGGNSSPGNSSSGNSYNNPAQPANTPPPSPANLASQDAHALTNSLGMKFVPAGTNGVLFSIWDTRVADFQQFVNETGYNATSGMWTLASNGWRQEGNSWSNPGFNQTPDSPVVGVSWNDANQFCLWLTNKERRAGLISAQQSYRLPTDAEWSAAAGNSTYPWGNDWPPPLNAGNYCRLGDGYSASTLSGTDGYACTSPVGSFQSNDYGLYDMGGNVFQYCEDWYHKELNSAEVLSAIPSTANDGGGQAYRVARGASWDHFLPLTLTSSFRVGTSVDYRESCTGFRCVLTKPASSSGTTIAEGVLVLAGLAAAWYYFKGRPKPAATADSTA